MEKMILDLWNEHRRKAFPEGCGGKDIQGIDLTLIDAYVAGCVHTFIVNGHQSKYRLDEPEIAILGKCYRDLAIIQPFLPSEEVKEYFTGLETMAGLILEWIGGQHSNM